uniref:NADH-ubiquinone oxidoreductase chain 2 n=1 Tax=Aplidium conicum TaxID=286149 RepID=D1GKZ7_APLCO|nr:NADH dehydrogenase subunit 2 [Aplidium conicum]CAX68851.1 NADH dehydrogenase subunit 2 [Aplidium conicum]
MFLLYSFFFLSLFLGFFLVGTAPDMRPFEGELIGYTQLSKGGLVFKYFLIQMLAGLCLLMIMFLTFFSMMDKGWGQLLILFFLSVKVGFFPGHGWVIETYGVLTFMEMFFLGIVPKLPSFFLMWMFFDGLLMMSLMVGFFSLVIGVLGGLKSTSVRHLLGLSSIMNMGWMLFALYLGLDGFFLCFLIYLVVSFTLYMSMTRWGISSYLSFTQGNNSHKILFIIGGVFFIMLGVPVGLLFFFKLYVIMNFFPYVILVLLLFFNSISILMYVRFFWFIFFTPQMSLIFINFKTMSLTMICMFFGVLLPTLFLYFNF